MSRPNSLVTAVGLFTVIPTPPTEIDRALGARAMRMFPVVGLLLGVVAALIVVVLNLLTVSGLFVAVAVVAAWAGLTGGLHLDGVGDTADGLGSRKPPEQALAIMRQSDIGPMGVIAIVFVLLAETAVLSGAGPELTWVVLVAPMVGRTCCVLACDASRPGARASGFGALFAGSVSRGVVMGWTLVCLALCALAGAAVDLLVVGAVGRAAVCFIVAAVLTLLVGWVQASHFIHRLGGLTGDTFGALVETATLVFCVGVTLLLGVRIW